MTNNNGKLNYDGKLKKILKYKFSKIDKFDEFEPEIIFDKSSLIFFSNKGSILKFDDKTKLIWEKNYYTKSEKKLKPILFFALMYLTMRSIFSVRAMFGFNTVSADNLLRYESILYLLE